MRACVRVYRQCMCVKTTVTMMYIEWNQSEFVVSNYRYQVNQRRYLQQQQQKHNFTYD